MLRHLRNHLAKRGLGSRWMLSLDLSKLLSLQPTPFPLPKLWLSQEDSAPWGPTSRVPPGPHSTPFFSEPGFCLCYHHWQGQVWPRGPVYILFCSISFFLCFFFPPLDFWERQTDRDRERDINFFVSLIHSFIHWLLHVPWPENKGTTLVYPDTTLINWATRPIL